MNVSHFIPFRDERLRQAVKSLLFEQKQKTAGMAFLPPDVDHVLRVRTNANRLATNECIRKKLDEVFGRYALRVVDVAAMLSKIGFAHAELNPLNSASFGRNRIFALELLLPFKEVLAQDLQLSPAQYAAFIEAIMRQGTFGTATSDNLDDVCLDVRADARLARVLTAHGFDDPRSSLTAHKYANPLTALLTLASEMDVSRERLHAWQRNELVMKILIEISAEPSLAASEIEQSWLSSELSRLRKSLLVPSAANVPENVAEIEAKCASLSARLDASRKAFQSDLEQLVHHHVVAPKDEIIGRFVKNGMELRAAKEMFETVASHLVGMTGNCHLWYVASNSITSTHVTDDGTVIELCQSDVTDSFGAAAALSHLRDFHTDRLNGVVRRVNEDLGTDIRVKCRNVRRDPDLWDHCQSLFKGDTHMHLKMSVMANRVWGNLIGPQLDVYGTVFEESQQLFNTLRSRRNLPQNVKLKDLFAEANQRANRLFDFITHYRGEYAWPDNKDELIIDAQRVLREEAAGASVAEKQSVEDDIRLYQRLRFHVTRLFSFTDGSLPDFVKHFTAVSKLLSKISPTDERTTLKALTHQMLFDAAQNGVWYVEPRFNIGGTLEGTLNELVLVLQAYQEFQRVNPGQPVPLMKIILSITKFGDEEKPVEERRRHKTASAQIFVGILKDAHQRFLAGNQPYEASGKTRPVTPQDLLTHLAGLDAAGQEESNPPVLFFEAFRIVEDWNSQLESLNSELAAACTSRNQPIFQLSPIGMTFHVSESVADVSIESGIRHLFEAIYMQPFPEVDDQEKPVLERVGHAIVVALADYDQLRGTTRKEPVAERIRQVEFDLKLCRMGIPMLSLNEPALEDELQDLTRYIVFRNDMTASGKRVENSSLAAIADRWGIDEDDRVTSSYSDDADLIDLETRAGLARDFLIRHNIVVETNPTSNVGISPYIYGYADHTLKTYLDYEYGQWALNPRLAAALEQQLGSGNRARAARARGALRKLNRYQQDSLEYYGQKVRVTINTDDGTLFGVNLIDEYYRIATALKLGRDRLSQLAEESTRSAIQPLPKQQLAELRERVAAGPPKLEMPSVGVGGLNELIVAQLKECGEQIDVTETSEPVMREGQPDDSHFYLVLSGKMQVTIGDRQVRMLHRNELFGEMAGATGKRSATVSTGEGGARLLKFKKPRFLELCRESKTVRRYIEQLILSRDANALKNGFESHFLGRPQPIAQEAPTEDSCAVSVHDDVAEPALA